jgi:hypothetical protein
MLPNSFWGLLNIAAAIGLTIVGSEITQYQSFLLVIGVACVLGAVIIGVIMVCIRVGVRPRLPRFPWRAVAVAMTLFIVLGSGAVWFYGPQFKTLPGFSAFAFVRLYDTPELRRKYIFDFASPDGSKVSFYLASDGFFRFTLMDINKESYALEVPVGNAGVPIDRYIFLLCEIALGPRETILRVLVDGREVRQRAYDLPISIESRKWQQVTFFADIEGKNNAPFKVAMSGFGHATWSDFQIRSFQRRFDEYLGAIGSSIARPK